MLPGPAQIIACPNCECERGTLASCAIRRRGSWVSARMNGVDDTPGYKRRTHPVVQAAVAAKARLKHFRGTASDPAPSASPNTCRPDCGMDGGFDQPDVTRRARRR